MNHLNPTLIDLDGNLTTARAVADKALLAAGATPEGFFHMRTFLAALFLVATACDLNPNSNVEPRALPGEVLCKALVQVCPLGEPDCQEMHLLCAEGAPCKACVLASELSPELMAVCESYDVYSECGLVCS